MLIVQYDLFGHREKTPNKDLVEKMVNAVYSMIQQVHSKLYECKILKKLIKDSEEEILIHFFMNTSNGLSPRSIIEMTGIFKKLGMGESIDKLIESVWDISYSFLPFVDLHYSRNKYDVKTLKNWRKAISEFDYNANKNQLIHIPR